MEVLIAPHAGFCFGVKMAIDKGEELIKDGQGPIATLGPLIHNPQEVQRLKELGIISRNKFNEIEEQKVLIRTHGVPPEVYDEAKGLGFEVLDCTCPYVSKVQKIAHKHSKEGYQVLILGNGEHPEVKGILGWALGQGKAFSSVEELEKLDLDGQRICLVAQTTENVDKFNHVVEDLEKRVEDLVVFNTICSATKDRQKAALELAEQVDLIIVIGGLNSANTQKLANLCRQTQTRTEHIELPDELQEEWFNGIEKVGITAGASTPDWIIREVIEKIWKI